MGPHLGITAWLRVPYKYLNTIASLPGKAVPTGYNAMETMEISYRLGFPDGSWREFDLALDPGSMELIAAFPTRLPSWTNLDFHQCPHCPLSVAANPFCPLAGRLAAIVESLRDVVSHDAVELEVVTPERRTTQATTAQRAVSSLMGLVMPVSGCPRTAWLRPMARFHLPLASEEETIFRTVSTYLLGQYFRKQSGVEFDLELTGLERNYDDLQTLNTAIAERLRAAGRTDLGVNALVILDLYSSTLPLVIEETLQEIRYLFAPYLDGMVGRIQHP